MAISPKSFAAAGTALLVHVTPTSALPVSARAECMDQVTRNYFKPGVQADTDNTTGFTRFNVGFIGKDGDKEVPLLGVVNIRPYIYGQYSSVSVEVFGPNNTGARASGLRYSPDISNMPPFVNSHIVKDGAKKLYALARQTAQACDIR